MAARGSRGSSAAAAAGTAQHALVAAVLLLHFALCAMAVAPQVGKKDGVFNAKNLMFHFYKTLFNNTDVMLVVSEKTCQPNAVFNVKWMLLHSKCYNKIANIPDMEVKLLLEEKISDDIDYTTNQVSMTCANFNLERMAAHPTFEKFIKTVNNTVKASNSTKTKREEKQVSKIEQKASTVANKNGKNVLTRTWRDGPYLFIMSIHPKSNTTVGPEWEIPVQVQMKSEEGFISAADWPLMIFYVAMCVLYSLYGALWLAWSACYWKDLLRIQFWIGAVILLGMLEKAVFYAEYHSINYYGTSVRGAVVFAELLSALKRTLARLLVIIVSLGYGIVKPRLGTTMYKVVGVGMLYLIFSSVEGILRISGGQEFDLDLLAAIPLAVLDTALCWWIFISLYQTMKMLMLRRNVVKLSLYRHFTNTLIFAIIASLIFIIWTTRKFRFAECQSDWRELWVEEAFWRLLFSLILLVIMVLWRPSANNQRYAFTPLLDNDEDEDEEEEPMMNEAYDGMKMRGSKPELNGSSRPNVNKQEDDLKWVEDNIPASMADVAMPALLDSDEEIMTTKFEMSKME
ncbi:transmembrane protein 87A isoform X2 [Petromyzon marinus]|uniref:Transmembrane protein 87A isoform X1 n=1 Tax=Petromyzon marinus TaxID=7757 RepID=A0AAJ7X4F9_PETMA|nr:transmembrane protein 87A isoform X1 [Petromyzon marinus]